LTGLRSLKKFESWNEEIHFKSDMSRDMKTLASVDDFRKHPKLRMSVISKRRINLAVIQNWLSGKQDLDESVIEALSK
jgi:eukaryotic translation initiation factor 2C